MRDTAACDRPASSTQRRVEIDQPQIEISAFSLVSA
jgi:hypothetical protein